MDNQNNNKKLTLKILGWVLAIIFVVLGVHNLLGAYNTLLGNGSQQNSIEQAVMRLQNGTTFPKEVNSKTTETAIEAEPNAIRFDYTIHDTDVSSISNDSIKSNILSVFCNNDEIQKDLNTGINFEYSYKVKDSSQTFFVSLGKGDCLAPQTQTASQTNTVSDSLGGNSYSNTKYGFQISPPTGWKTVEKQSGALVVFVNAQLRLTNILVTLKSPQNMALDDYANGIKANLLKTAQSSLIDDTSVNVNGIQGRLITVSSVDTVSSLSVNVVHAILVVVNDNQTYLIMGTAPKSDWDQYKSSIEASMLSFKLN